jgi:predicted TIM-barrel fold metal-dependent hydrolase
MSDSRPRVAHRQLVVRPEWLALRTEEILDPGLPIVDAHHHLWIRDGVPYLLPELLADLNTGHNIVATVFMECKAMYRRDATAAMAPVGEVEFVNGIAAMSASGSFGNTRVCAGIVGYADLNLGAAVRPVLEAEMVAGGGRFRGVRNISAWHALPEARGSSVDPPPDVLTRPSFGEGLRVLTSLGFTFDAWLYHTQLPELIAVARTMPEATIILNHVGGAIGIGPYAGQRDAVFKEWRASMLQLAKLPNVYVKLGGLGMRLFGFDVHEGALPPTSEQLASAWRPYIETCIEAFGAQRAMFESNFPVDKGSCGYAALWNAFKRITAGTSAEDRAALFSGTAMRVYRLGDVSRPAR